VQKLIVMPGTPNEWFYQLKEGQNSLGRGDGNDIQLIFPGISKKHCVLLYKENSLLVRDMGSTNGTYINNHRITEAVLHPGQVLMTGSITMQLDAPPCEISVPPLPAPDVPVQTYQEDGRPNCIHHPGTLAALMCVTCECYYCDECVSRIQLVGGKSLQLCRTCGNRCQTADVQSNNDSRERTFYERILDTLRRLFLTPPSKRHRKQR
jgi:hypothetical protein